MIPSWKREPVDYPTGSFQRPVQAPASDPDAGALVSVCFSAAWLPLVLGSLQQLILPATWQGDEAAQVLAIQRAELLMSIFGQAKDGCNVGATLIQRIDFPTGGAQALLSPIPAGYDEIKVRYHLRTNRAGQGVDSFAIQVNGDTVQAHYNVIEWGANVNTPFAAYAASYSTMFLPAAGAVANQFMDGEIDLGDYRSAHRKQLAVSPSAPNNNYGQVGVQQWTELAPITSLTLKPGIGTQFAAGSWVSLVGVKYGT